MSIPITIDKLLNDNVVEWARIEFKEGWNPDTTLKTIAAFANDIDNWGGGYIVIGVKEKDGRVSKPVKGLEVSQIDKIQKELLRYCKYIKPSYVPQSEPVDYNGKKLLLVWCPGGYDRPYTCPKAPFDKNNEKIYYIRKLSSTIEASEVDKRELMSLTNNVPFDDRVNIKAEIKDLKYPLIRNYLEEIDSGLLQNINNVTVEQLASDMRIADGPKEYYKPLNVGLMFFNDDMERFFPYSHIELVNIPDPTGQGMTERVFKGPLDRQLRDVLSYIRNNVIAEKVIKVKGQAEALRIFNYSYDAIEEFVSNAVYHKSYQIHEPITIRIEKEQIEITSIPGPDRSISDEDIKNYSMRARRYRNRRIGDFLKELHLVEGRNTGIPMAINAIKDNGSPLPKLLTDNERSYFTVIIPIHDSFKGDDDTKAVSRARKTRLEIKEMIMGSLKQGNKSMNQLYSDLGYKGNPSKTFSSCITDMIQEGIIEYTSKKKNSSDSTLTLIQ